MLTSSLALTAAAILLTAAARADTAPRLALASLEQHALGNFVAVHILSGTTGNTGAIDAEIASKVPDGGSTLTFLGSVLLGIGILGRTLSTN